MREYFPGRPVSLVLGVLADKNVAGMAQPLLDVAEHTWVTSPESPRRMAAGELAEVCATLGRNATAADSIADAVAMALEASGPDHVVVITGSFYTVGPARLIFVRTQDRS